jgi:HAD superfamily hydrolase (TIGR01490 family)
MLHIFDVDHTVINKSSMWHFLRIAVKTKIIRIYKIRRLPVDWIRYKLRSPNIDFIETAVKNLVGIERDALVKTADECFRKYIKRDIFIGAQKLIAEAQRKNERVIFASSSFDFVLQPLERFLGIDGLLACELEFRGGKTTGSLIGSSLFGVKKKMVVQEWLKRNNINPDEVSFYSDSYTDIPLLECCGNPVTVNPDRILRREAKKRGWKILRFKEVLKN